MSRVVNFGCRLNNFEGKKIEELLSNNNENIIVINSCAVTNETERQVRQTIRRIKKESPDKKIVMTGCAAQISPDKYSSMTEIDKVIDNISKLKSETWISLSHEESQIDFKEDIFDSPQDIRPSLDTNNLSIRESLVIQQGCNHRCTFCIIPFGRGNNRSFDPFYLIDEVERVVEMPHLHLSIQSGDDMILKRMKRRHNSKDGFEFVEHCKKIREDVSFGADIIAGFPTETDEMFDNTYRLLKENEISHLHIFPFSPKNNTPASRMPQVSKLIIKKRAKNLRELGELILKKVKSKLSLPREVLIEELNLGLAVGYDQNYIKHEVPLVGVPVGEIVRV